jgi:uncharacterized protein YndB with AHSA1/START domain
LILAVPPKSSPFALKKHLGAMDYLILLQTSDDDRIKKNVMSKKQLFTLEFPVRCSPAILYEFLATPAGLQEWFADKVDEWEGVYSFSWNGQAPDKADVLEKEEDKFIRYHWQHTEKNEYFEFRIEKTEISNQTILIIKDFAEKSEIKDQSQLWQSQIKELFHRLGA